MGGRLLAQDAGNAGAVLVLDEIQKIPGWSETTELRPDSFASSHLAS
jgi:hypothetical protein